MSLGVADFVAGATVRRDSRPNAAMVYTAIAAGTGAIVALLTLPIARPEVFATADVFWAMGAGVSIGIALPLLMVGMGRGPMAIVAPVIGLTSLAVPAIVGPLLGDVLSGLEVAGLLLAFPATALVAMSPHRSDHALPVPRALAIAALSGSLLGTSAVFYGRTATESGIGPGVVSQVTATLLLLGIGLVSRRLIRPTRSALPLAVWVGVLSGFATLTSVLAYQRGPVSIVAAIIGLAPGPAVVLAWLVANERIGRLQIIGFAVGVLAVILFAIG